MSTSADRFLELAAEVLDLVAQPSGVLEPKIGGCFVHLLLECPDESLELGRRQVVDTGPASIVLAGPAVAPGDGCTVLSRPQVSEDVGDSLDDALWVDAVRLVVFVLEPAP